MERTIDIVDMALRTAPNIAKTRTMASELQVDDIADFNVDDTQETLIPLLELALVENLDSNHGALLHRAMDGSEQKSMATR